MTDTGVHRGIIDGREGIYMKAILKAKDGLSHIKMISVGEDKDGIIFIPDFIDHDDKQFFCVDGEGDVLKYEEDCDG